MACEYEKKYNELKEAYEKLDHDKFWNDVIPKSKVKDIISELKEEYELLLEHQSGRENKKTIKIQHYIQILEELLKRMENKNAS